MIKELMIYSVQAAKAWITRILTGPEEGTRVQEGGQVKEVL